MTPRGRTCVDACGGCDAGTCVKVSEGVFQCRESAVSCSGNLCEPGQVACLGGACACLSSLSGALDTCQAAGKWCNGKVCANPRSLQQCTQGDSTARPAPRASSASPSSEIDLAICTSTCMDNNDCAARRVLLAAGLPALWASSRDQECKQNIRIRPTAA